MRSPNVPAVCTLIAAATFVWLCATSCGILEFQGVEVGVTQTQGTATRTASINSAEYGATALTLTGIFGVPDNDSEVQAQRDLARALREASRDAERRHADHVAAEAAEAARAAAEGSGDVTVNVDAAGEPAPEQGGGLPSMPDAPKTIEEGKAYVLWAVMLLLAAIAYRVFRYGIPGFRRELRAPTRSNSEHHDTD